MFDRLTRVPARSRRGRRAHANDTVELPPAVTAGALTGAVVGGGWLLDALGTLPTQGGAVTAAVAAAGVLGWAGTRTRAARRSVARGLQADREAAARSLEAVVAAVDRGRQSVRRAAGQAPPVTFARSAAPPRATDTGADVVAVLEQAFEESRALVKAATGQRGMLSAQAELAEIFTSISPRLQSLVNRGISMISEVERTVEDPELLADLFRVDHLLTQIRRAVESLAVLGGHTPSRDSAPVLLATAVRRAVAEISDYQRVRVGMPQHAPLALPGYVSPNVVHLLAALMENATAFSTDKVEVFTHQTEHGIAIELLDRGPGISQQKREALNRLLADPEAEDPRARLREGKIGLLVAALLAKRHRITIQLGPNIVGGTRAIVVIPQDLVVSADVLTPNGQPAQQPPQPAAAGRARPEPTPQQHPEDTAAPPRHQPAGPVEPAPAAAPPPPHGSRPPLPRRGRTDRLPPPPQQAPAGSATSGLMASFRSRRPSGDESAAQPPGA